MATRSQTRTAAKFDALSARAVTIVLMALAAARRLAPGSLGSEVARMEAQFRAQAHQTQTVIAGIVIGAALLIGFFVVSTIDDALNLGNDPDTSLDEDKNSTLDRIGDGLLIGGVIIIVLMAAVILRVLRGL